MNPVSPVILTKPSLSEVHWAENQAQYRTLPSVVSFGASKRVTTRWRLSWRERFKILVRGNLWVSMLTFGEPLQPILPEVDEPDNVLS